MHFHTNFKILCSSSLKSAIGILMEIALNRQISLHKMFGHYKNINFSNSWTWCTFPSACVIFSVFHQCLAVSQCRSYVSLLLLFFSHSVESKSLWSHGLECSRLPCPSPSPRVWSNSFLLSRWWYPSISSSFVPFSISQHQGLFQWVSSLNQIVKVLELWHQHQSFQWIFRIDLLQDWLVLYPCSPRDSQESSLTPQFKSISSLVLSFHYSPNLTSIHDYWKNHSFD